jgi:ABC-type phosphate transport system substrate-binding protein
VALDGITVVSNPQNDFANNITLDQLRTLWETDAEARSPPGTR